MINKSNPLPLYYQVKAEIIKNIESGEYEPNKSIPTELELQHIFGVSRTTVRQAVSELVLEGYLYRKRGIGTFVAGQSLTPLYDSFLPGLNTSELIRLNGGTVTKKIVRYDKIIASQKICDILSIDSHSNVYIFYRLEYSDDVPTSLTRTYIPCHLVGNFKRDIKKIESGFHEYLDNRGYPIEILEGNIKSRNIHDEFTLSTLNLTENDPILVIKMVNKMRDGTPIEYSRTVLNCKNIEFPVKSQRIPSAKKLSV